MSRHGARVDFPRAAWERHLRQGGRAFPLDIRVTEGRGQVAVNRSGLEAIEAGAELVALNGEPMARWLERVERHVSAETPYLAHSLMEHDFPRDLWLAAYLPFALVPRPILPSSPWSSRRSGPAWPGSRRPASGSTPASASRRGPPSR